ncbi:MAG: hypothetical protein ACI85O_001139 [Saprospiraceae bacterium]|jgi:hypothetical protein
MIDLDGEYEILKQERNTIYSMKNKILLAAVLGLFFSLAGNAQGTFQPKAIDDTPKGVVYNKEFTVNFTAHTNGFALGVDFGRLNTYYKTRYYHFSIGELKHSREVRSDIQATIPSTIVSRSYIFGKQNNLYALRVGLGNKRYLTEKARDRGVSVALNYEFGPTLGLLKPYYLEVYVPESVTSQSTRSVRYTEETASQFSDPSRIFGASSRVTGLGEIKPTLGAHGKFSVHFDWGAFDEFVKALYVGVMVDVFLQKTPILIDGANINNEAVENRNLFLNLFVNLQFGKRK